MTPPWTAANKASKTDVEKSISDFLFSFLEAESDSFVRRDFLKRVSLTSPILNFVHSIKHEFESNEFISSNLCNFYDQFNWHLIIRSYHTFRFVLHGN
jgi:hypothetical protein